MRNEETIIAELEAAKAEYAEAYETKPAKVCGEISDRVKSLNQELSDARSKGAKPCPKCGNPPMGIIKRPSYIDRDGIEQPTIREVGCIHCPPELVEGAEGTPVSVNGETVNVKRVSYSSRGLTIKDTVENWNADKYVVDSYFGRCPMTFRGEVVPPFDVA